MQTVQPASPTKKTVAVVSSRLPLPPAADRTGGAGVDREEGFNQAQVKPATSQREAPSSWAIPEDPLSQASESLQGAWSQVLQLTEQGEFSRARAELSALCRDASSAAAAPELLRRLRCAEIALAVELGDDAPRAELRELLMKAESLKTQMVASYQLAHALEMQRSWKKARFYGRRALVAARDLKEASSLAVAHNLLGNIQAGDSCFAAAEGHYRRALEHGPRSPLWVAQVKDNLAYVLAAQGAASESRGYLADSLRILRRHGGRARLSVELDAAFVLASTNQPHTALRHALRAQELALELNDYEQLGNALLLIAESAKRSGNLFLARRSVQRLAEHRGEPEMAIALFGVNLLDAVNLKG